MNTLFIQGSVTRIRQRGDLLMIKKGGDDEEEMMTSMVSPVGLEQIIISGDHSLSTGALGLVSRHGGVITVLDERGVPLGQFLPFEKNVLIGQYEKQISLSLERRLELAKIICAASLANRGILLKKVMQKTGHDLSSEIRAIQEAMSQIPDCTNANSLRGIEGSGAHAYFEGIKGLLPDVWGFTGRVKHPSRDPVNALLSYGYGMLYGSARLALVCQGLSPYYGVFHESYRKQEALVYDFVEEFRQVIVDRVVLTFLNRKNASPSDFSLREDGSCLIQNPVRKKFVHHVLERLSSKATGTGETYSQHLKIQAGNLASAILQDTVYYPFTYR